jgi:hypothetical protein
MTPEQNEIIERLRRDREWLAAHGADLSQWGPDPESGKVKVYLARYSDEARQLLDERYGPGIVVSTESRSFVFGTGRGSNAGG